MVPGPGVARPPSAPRVVVRPRYRILITASREWVDPWKIWNWLFQQYEAAWTVNGERLPVTVVHGDAGGGDQVAKLWAIVHNQQHEAHPAAWTGPCIEQCQPHHRKTRKDGTEYCPAAGMYRNYTMVKTGADVCGAFIHNMSQGTRGCAALAKREGIPTEEFHAYSV